ncbi:MAG: hypothetical protein IJV98_00365 [Clostridia bacterium]|nr:hypothetical protein [Clostridia bacterium]
MKKLVAFLMAFALTVMCFGTYGVAHLDCADDCSEHDHSHDLVVNAVDEDDDPIFNEYLYINRRNTTYAYSEMNQKLVVKLYISSESTEKGAIGHLEIQTPYNSVLGAPTVTFASVFGTTASAAVIDTPSNATSYSYSTITFDVDTSGFTQDAAIFIEYPVNVQNALQFYWMRTVQINVNGNVRTVSGAGVSFEHVDSYTVYLCNHSSSEYVETKAATCEAAGEKRLVCSSCGYVIKTETILPTQHRLDYSKAFNTNLYPEIKPTCTKVGSGCYKCLDCGKLINGTVPKLEHQFGDRYIKNNTYYMQCSVCKTEQIATNQCPHDQDAYILLSIVSSSTCTTEGSARYQCPTCKQVEARPLPLADHKLGTPTIIKNATCLVAGSQSRTCSVCKQSIAETIPATGHNYGAWQVVTPATCVTLGQQTRTCATCGYRETQNIQGSGHSYGDWVITTAPTCTAPGVQTMTCRLCGDAQSQPVAAAGHTYGNYMTTLAPTCIANGQETRYCTKCNAPDQRVVAPVADNHKYGEWVTVSDKTCTTNGEKTQTCVYCQNVVRDIVPTTGHTFGEPVVDGKITTKTCAVCGYKESVETLKDGTTKKTLTINSVASLVITGIDAGKNYSFEARLLNETEDDMVLYRQYYVGHLAETFLKAYRFKILCDGVEVSATPNMTVVLNTHIDGYELAVSKLAGVNFLVTEVADVDEGNVTIDGANLIGTTNLFVERGEEIKTNILIPVIVTVAILLIGGAAVYFVVVKKKQF